MVALNQSQVDTTSDSELLSQPSERLAPSDRAPALLLSRLSLADAMAVGKNKRLSKGKKGKGKKV